MGLYDGYTPTPPASEHEKWEMFHPYDGAVVRRLKVPGGWLYLVESIKSLVFVPER